MNWQAKQDMQQRECVQNQRRANGIENLICLERVGLQIKDGVLEPPIIPNVTVLIHRPCRRAGNVIGQLRDEWIRQHECQD